MHSLWPARVVKQRRAFKTTTPEPLQELQEPRLPSLSRVDSADAGASNQSAAALLSKLPAEIRLAIWEYALGHQRLHIVHKFRRLGHVTCDDDYWRELRSPKPSPRAKSIMFTAPLLASTTPLAEWSLCNLLLTCRQICAEARNVLYRTNTFLLWDVRLVKVFRNGLRTCSWQNIRYIDLFVMWYQMLNTSWPFSIENYLQLEAWPSACAAMATLPELRRLRINIANPVHFAKAPGVKRNQQRAGLLDFLGYLRTVQPFQPAEIYFPIDHRDDGCGRMHWNTRQLEKHEIAIVARLARQAGIDCRCYTGSLLCNDGVKYLVGADDVSG